jgi:hypothetical protein
MVIVPEEAVPAHAAETPAGNPVAVPMPVAPVVAIVMFVRTVLIHNVGVDEGLPAVFKGVTVKLLLLVPVPAELVTLIVPVVAVAGNVAEIVVLLVTENEADTPLKFTTVAPVKLVPVIVTIAPEP